MCLCRRVLSEVCVDSTSDVNVSVIVVSNVYACVMLYINTIDEINDFSITYLAR